MRPGILLSVYVACLRWCCGNIIETECFCIICCRFYVCFEDPHGTRVSNLWNITKSTARRLRFVEGLLMTDRAEIHEIYEIWFFRGVIFASQLHTSVNNFLIIANIHGLFHTLWKSHYSSYTYHISLNELFVGSLACWKLDTNILTNQHFQVFKEHYYSKVEGAEPIKDKAMLPEVLRRPCWRKALNWQERVKPSKAKSRGELFSLIRNHSNYEWNARKNDVGSVAVTQICWRKKLESVKSVLFYFLA